MKKILLLLLFLLIGPTLLVNAQNKKDLLKKSPNLNNNTYQDMVKSFSDYVTTTNKGTNIVTGMGFNYFLQKKLSYYLTGSTGINFAKAYSTFSSSNGRLSLGYNIIKQNKDTKRIDHLINPTIEAGIEDDFSTLFKKGNWQSDIRFGVKWTHFIHKINISKSKVFQSTVSYYITPTKEHLNHQDKMRFNRTISAYRLIQKMKKQENEYIKEIDTLSKLLTINFWGIDNKQQELIGKFKKSYYVKDYKKELLDYKIELAKIEADSLETKNSYTWFHTTWFSIGGYFPVTQKSYYISSDPSQLFTERKLNTWEVNGQINYLHGWHSGKAPVSFLASLEYRLINNNSGLAKLIDQVDYDIYSQLPGNNPLNLAKLETKKAYIGDFKNFITHNINLNLVLNTSSENAVNGGISFRIDKNFGFYNAIDLRIGLPFSLQGKESIINIEPQLRLPNINNYANSENYRLDPIFGINVGLPFIALYKQ